MSSFVRGTAADLDATYTDGGVGVTPTDPVVSIRDPFGNTVVDNAVPTEVMLGLYSYTFNIPVDAPLGAWVAVWQGLINDFPSEALDVFYVTDEPSTPEPPTVGFDGCELWALAADLECSAAITDEALLALIEASATSALFQATGGQFTGLCEDTIRPCSRSAFLFQSSRYALSALPYTADGGRWIPEGWPVGCSCSNAIAAEGVTRCGCVVHRALTVPNVPLVKVVEVKIDGVVVTDDWVIEDNRTLLRQSGAWPCCQKLWLPDTEPGTFSLRYQYGTAIPAPLQLAARTLLCEYCKAFAGDSSCNLPKRLTSMTREGMTLAILDPFSFLDEGRFGIYSVDTAIAQYNPQGLRRDARILNPDLLAAQAHRIR